MAVIIANPLIFLKPYKMKLKYLLILSALSLLSSCYNNEQNTSNKPTAPTSNTQVTEQKGAVKIPTYEIIRQPNGGQGVFDFMYIVYVPKKYTHEEFDAIFSDIVNKYSGDKISIDVWDSREIFKKTLAIYQEEDRLFDAGKPIKSYMDNKKSILDSYDKHNIAKYDKTADGITKTYPDEME